MSRPIIEVSGLSKRYVLGEIGFSSFREETQRWINRWRGRGSASDKATLGSAATEREFWALRDVSFSINPGDVVGIIGRNGAGKSTLLKILSRITEPTSGEVILRGRVASLLEVGTGFHPELSGRDNIFLNGAILGMKRPEIAAKLDEIIAFAEIEKFIDTPVKRYSSGMYVKLAFAVAAHLEPDILIVDEVLAVGDASFQRKCVAKMGEVSGHGRTVLFVSHNFGLVQALCSRGVYLDQGKVAYIGSATDAIHACRRSYEVAPPARLGNERLLRAVTLVDATGRVSDLILPGRKVVFQIETAPTDFIIQVILRVNDSNQTLITSFDSANPGLRDTQPSPGPLRYCVVDDFLLAPGRYQLDIELWANGHRLELTEAALWFEVGEGEMDGRFIRAIKATGVVPLRHHWITDGSVSAVADIR